MNFETLIERGRKYLHGEEIIRAWLGDGAVPVSQELAESRSRVCIACPLNEKGLTPIESVADAIRKLVEVKNGLELTVENEDALHTCTACTCPLRTKIWIPLERILPDDEERTKLDAKCWLLSESK